MRHAWMALGVALGTASVGCGGVSAEGAASTTVRAPKPAQKPPEPAPQSAERSPTKPQAPPEAAAAAPPPAAEGSPAAAAAPAELPETVAGADIPRAQLLLVLQQGVGRMLQKVHIEPHLERGHFAGWTIVSLFDGTPELSRGLLLPGDTLLRVNGQSIERPEQFKNVWDSLPTEAELVLRIARNGKQSEIRHRIVQ